MSVDYNDYYTSGLGGVGYLGGDFTTLADWRERTPGCPQPEYCPTPFTSAGSSTATIIKSELGYQGLVEDRHNN